jgi:hypothetical protein
MGHLFRSIEGWNKRTRLDTGYAGTFTTNKKSPAPFSAERFAQQRHRAFCQVDRWFAATGPLLAAYRHPLAGQDSQFDFRLANFFNAERHANQLELKARRSGKNDVRAVQACGELDLLLQNVNHGNRQLVSVELATFLERPQQALLHVHENIPFLESIRGSPFLSEIGPVPWLAHGQRKCNANCR